MSRTVTVILTYHHRKRRDFIVPYPSKNLLPVFILIISSVFQKLLNFLTSMILTGIIHALDEIWAPQKQLQWLVSVNFV
jgi:hypothetical protein